jgi:hypothetical protein
MSQLHTCFKGGDDNKRPGYWLGFQYDIQVIERMKREVPHTDRVWDEGKKLWWVSEAYESVLTEIFGNFYALTKLQGSLF